MIFLRSGQTSCGLSIYQIVYFSQSDSYSSDLAWKQGFCLQSLAEPLQLDGTFHPKLVGWWCLIWMPLSLWSYSQGIVLKGCLV
ncbi:hypothetical protein Csa_003288 [Cucumis sativus]|uniref:Uncharacterized protein n=1 Tax=Cucumis sativus TaxID=3659 RepID=A0A0A0KGP4_CUCSA|nr:hypothetical protein Csa_003288 [Cucumis sativus]